MFDTTAKAGFGFFIILAFLGFIVTDAVSDPLMLFITVGVVPGTNVTLSPNTMLLGAGMVLLGVAVLILRNSWAHRSAPQQKVTIELPEETIPARSTTATFFSKQTAFGSFIREVCKKAVLRFKGWLPVVRRWSISQAIWVWFVLSSSPVQARQMIKTIKQDTCKLSSKLQALIDKAVSYFDTLAR